MRHGDLIINRCPGAVPIDCAAELLSLGIASVPGLDGWAELLICPACPGLDLVVLDGVLIRSQASPRWRELALTTSAEEARKA